MKILDIFMQTAKDVAPIILLLFFFQYIILRKRVRNLKKVIVGLLYITVGLALFLIGLDQALFPLGQVMSTQLTSPEFLGGGAGIELTWKDYYWTYAFAAAIGFATTIAEPSLIAVAMKAGELSGGRISARGLRIAVAIGVSASIALGVFRIVTGTPLHWYMMAGYLIVVIQTIFTPKWLVPLAYDSGGVTTSTVTVPLVTALGLGLASTVPGRSVLIDGFGLIALASLFPMITVMGYAQLSELVNKAKKSENNDITLENE
jgi:hypothetical protein